jgi:hypothetical protein
MTAPITERIREHVLRRGPVSAEQVAAAIPELADRGGEQRALLLMRLDPQLERAGTALWAARGTVLTDERQVHRAAEDYFRTLDRPGAPLSSAATVIAERTHVDVRRVQEILRERYVVAGPNVFSRRRQQEED